MSARYTIRDDYYIFEYVEGGGVDNVAHDLGKTPKSIQARIAKLHATGGWAALREKSDADLRYRMAMGFKPFPWEEGE